MLNIGLIGLGNHMISQIYPVFMKLPVKISAVCDIDPLKIERFRLLTSMPEAQTFLSYEEMLESGLVNAVVCVGKAKLHYEAVKACLSRNIAVFVEKTPCETAGQCEEICELQKDSSAFAMVGFNRRFTTSYRMMKEIIGREEFGKQRLYFAKYNSSEYPSADYFIFNHTIHHLDLMRYLLGEIAEISAKEVIINDKKIALHIDFVSESGVMGALQSGSLQCESYPMERVEITGDNGVVIADNVKSLQYNKNVDNKTAANPVLTLDNTLIWNYNMGHSSMYSHYGYERELQHFVDAAEGRCTCENTFEDTLGTMALYEKLLKNIKVL